LVTLLHFPSGDTMTLARPLCIGCFSRDLEIEKLQKRITELESCCQRLRQQLDEVQRSNGRQAARFRRRALKRRRKKPGRRRGHPAALRPLPTPERIDRVIDVPLPECPDCHFLLQDPSVVVQFQTDLPPIVPIVTQFNLHTGYCPACGRYHQARHPEQTSDAIGAAGNTLGPVVLTMAAEMKHRLGVPYRKICDFLRSYADLHVCPATFVRAEQRLAQLAQPTYQLLLEALRQCHVVHADETGWRIDRHNAWLWVFSSKDVTIYAIRHSRGHDVPQDILGPDFNGYLIVDGLNTYDVLEVAKGRCNSHLLRRCKDLMDVVPAAEQTHVTNLTTLLQDAIDLAQRREQLPPDRYARRVDKIENRLDSWLDQLPASPSPDLNRLDNHVRRHRGEWLVFLHDAEVPPTNNHAEQMLRPAFITRKVGGCNKTLLGAMVHGILASIMVTCKRRGHSFLELAQRLWQAGDAEGIPLAAAP
jgi:transposase